MCDPGTMTVLALASAAVGGVGQYQSMKGQQAALTYQSQLDEVNAINADRAARDALERGELDAVKHGREVAKLRGQQTVGWAAAGLDLGFGTPLEVAGDTDLLAAEDTRTIYENANREAEGFRINAANYRASAAGARAQRANVGTEGILSMASTAVNTATQIGGQWQKYGKPKWGKK